MILAVDSSALILLVNPAADPPDDPTTKKPLDHARARVEQFIANLTANDTLIIPTPVLAEALVRAGDGGPGLLAALSEMARVKVRPFGERSAVETAMMTREALQAGDKRDGSEAPWQKVKVDRQVIAIARVEGATRIYADDHDLVAFARRLGMEAFSTWDLPVPDAVANLFTAAGVPMESSAELVTKSPPAEGGISSRSDLSPLLASDPAASAAFVDEAVDLHIDPALVTEILKDLAPSDASDEAAPAHHVDPSFAGELEAKTEPKETPAK